MDSSDWDETHDKKETLLEGFLKARLYLSEAAIRQHAIETGEMLSKHIKRIVPLKDMTSEQRQQFLEVTGLGHANEISLASLEDYDPPFGIGYEATLVPRTPEAWLEIANQHAKARKEFRIKQKLEQDKFQLQREEQEKLDAEALARTLVDSRALDKYKLLYRWEQISGDIEAQFKRIRSSDARREFQIQYDELCAHRRQLVAQENIRNKEQKALQEKAAEKLKEAERIQRHEQQKWWAQLLAEILEWAEKHGTEMLIRGAKEGQDIREMYAFERARFEHPEFTLDLHNRANWEKLEEIPKVLEQSLQNTEGTVVWLLYPPRKLRSSEIWQPRYGVVIRQYHGAYNLVRELL